MQGGKLPVNSKHKVRPQCDERAARTSCRAVRACVPCVRRGVSKVLVCGVAAGCTGCAHLGMFRCMRQRVQRIWHSLSTIFGLDCTLVQNPLSQHKHVTDPFPRTSLAVAPRMPAAPDLCVHAGGRDRCGSWFTAIAIFIDGIIHRIGTPKWML